MLIDHEIDVLVCTPLIETGVDVPNANTLIIDNADRLGPSQLHQIRGRVGRSSRRAYAYLTFTRNKVLSEVAQKRLSAIREFTEFGSGFKIAMRDLEIRGAGNILGGEQHGHMESVGYDMYLKLLTEAIQREKGEEVPAGDAECLVDMQIQAHIPEGYISSLSQRLDIYRRIADIRSFDDASDVIDELIDRYGEPPAAVKGLIDVALLRNMASRLGVSEVKQQEGKLLQSCGGKAIGLCGIDGGMLQAEKLKGEVDLGFVGDVKCVNIQPVRDVLDAGYIPVIATVGVDEQMNTYNINADTAAAAIAAALKAENIILMTDVRGLLENPEDENTLIPVVNVSDVPHLIHKGIIKGGMIPKCRCCVEAVRRGVQKAFIIDGRIQHSILIEMLSDKGIGTMFI